MTHSKKLILVTGGAGYIGAHNCATLAQLGYQPVVFDNLSRGYSENVKWGPLFEGDLLSLADLREVFRQYEFVGVMHFAGLAQVAESVENPEMYMRHNVMGTKNLLLAMSEAGVSRLIFSSSCSVYGEPFEVITESTPTVPVNPYGLSKLLAEQAIREWTEQTQGSALALRYFNVAGDGEFGIEDGADTRIVPRFVRAANLGESVEIYGQDYPTLDGTCVRDYIHVSDLSEAHVRALDWVLSQVKPNSFEVMNVAGGQGVSNLQIAEAVENLSGEKLHVRYHPRRLGDPAQLVGSSQKILTTLGWRPQRSTIEAMVTSLWPKFKLFRDNDRRIENAERL